MLTGIVTVDKAGFLKQLTLYNKSNTLIIFVYENKECVKRKKNNFDFLSHD